MIRHLAITFLLIGTSVATNAQSKTETLVDKTLKCKVLSETTCPPFKHLLSLQENAVPQLLAALKSEDQRKRANAARIIARTEIGPAKRRSLLLIDALKTTEGEFAGETIEALGRIGHKTAIEPLLARLKADKNGRNQIYLLNAVGRFQGDNIRAAIIPFLESSQPRLQLAAVANLGRMKDAAVIAPIIQRALAPLTAGYVREEAARVLALRADPRANGPLLILLANPNHRVRQSAARALGALKVRAAVPILLVQLKDPDVMGAAADALGQIRDKRATAALVGLSSDLQTNTTLRKKALWSLGLIADTAAEKTLLDLIDAKDQQIAVAAAETLGQAGNKTVVDELIKRLDDPRAPVGRACAWALEKITKKSFGLDRPAWTAWRTEN